MMGPLWFYNQQGTRFYPELGHRRVASGSSGAKLQTEGNTLATTVNGEFKGKRMFVFLLAEYSINSQKEFYFNCGSQYFGKILLAQSSRSCYLWLFWYKIK